MDTTMEEVIVLLSELFPHMTSENWELLLQEPDVKEFGEGVLVRAYQMEHPPIKREIWGEEGETDEDEDVSCEDLPW